MMRPDNLDQLADDPVAFRKSLLIETDAGPMPLDATLDDWQRRDFEALDSGWRAVAGHDVADPRLRGYLERPRGHSKTNDTAVSLAWVLFAASRPLSGVAAAADKEQARLLRDAIAKLVQLNPWLSKFLDITAYKVRNPHTGSTLEIISSDAATSFGLTPDFVVAEELTHWSSRDLWDSLFSAAAKRARCMFIVISNSGYGQSWQWEVREAVQQHAAWYFSRLDGPVASWITPDRLEEQRKLLPPIAYARLWLNRWTSGVGDAIEPSDVRAAVTLPGPLAGPELGWVYVAGVDLSVKHDASSVVVLGRHVGHCEEVTAPAPARPRMANVLAELHGGLDSIADSVPDFVQYPGSGRIRVAAVRLWQPRGSGGKIDLEAVEREIANLHRLFRFGVVGFDPWNAALLIQRLQRQGIPTEEVPFTAGNLQSMSSAVLGVFREREIELFDHAELLADIGNLRIVEKQYGFRLESPRQSTNGTKHGDTATAFSIAMHLAGRFDFAPAPHIEGPLICWP